MSIEDIQKVNKLAQDLLDKNMASSREEAVKQAQQILNKTIAEKQEIDNQGNVAAKDDFEYYKNIITRCKDYTLQQLNEFKKQLETLTAEVKKLKDEIAVAGFNKNQSNPDKKEIKQAKQPKLKDKKEQSNPRKGDFNSKDVAIEDIFYYGNK
ncbi:hypothetical protein KY342_06225 [Candidatus Woesearchaeota archaeon]|nr:hypothetical protein [Candidatus Woesearchaeota archaeon]